MDRLNNTTWNRFKADLESLNYNVARLKLKFTLMDETGLWAHNNGLPLFTTEVNTIFEKIVALDKQAQAINTAYSYTQSLIAGVRNSDMYPGDFDIVAPEGALNSQQIQQATVDLDALNKPPFNLGIAPIVIVAGVAVVALVVGAIATVSIMSAKEKELETEVDKMQIELEKEITSMPELIQDWTEYKRVTQGKTRGLIDNLLGPGAGSSILSGAGGIAALLVVGYFAMKWFEKSKGANK